MKILKQDRVKNSVSIEIQVEYPEFKQAFEKAMAEAGRSLRLPGFRPGKVPKSIVEKSFDAKTIENHAAQDLISELYPQIIKETKIDPIDYPAVDIVTLEAEKPFVFKITVSVYPEVKLKKYKGLKATKKSIEVTEEEVTKVLGNLQDRFARLIDISDREVQKDDIIDFEILADINGEPIKRWPKKLQQLSIGPGMIHPDFDNQLIGLKIGENKEFKITFDANNPSPEIAGKEVNFKVKIEKIRAKEVLPLDDEFAKKISKYGTLAEFTAELKVSLEMEKKEDAEADLKNTLTEEAIKNAEIDVPDAMIKWESNIMLEELKTSLLRSNLTLDDYLKGIKKTEQEVREEFKNPSTVRAKGKIVLKKIAELEKIVVTPEDIETEIRLIAESEGKSADEYRASLGQNGVEYIEDYLLRRKALDFLVENAEIK